MEWEARGCLKPRFFASPVEVDDNGCQASVERISMGFRCKNVNLTDIGRRITSIKNLRTKDAPLFLFLLHYARVKYGEKDGSDALLLRHTF